MGCLFACFGACKHRKRRPLVNATTHFEPHRHEACAEDVQVIEFTKKEEETERPISLSSEKQNAFECNVVKKHEAREDLQVIEFTKKQEETEQSFSMSREKLDERVNCNTIKKVTFDLDVKTSEEPVVNNLVKDNETEEIPKDTKLVSHIPNNRYQNCATSEDESEDLGLEESDLDDDSGGGGDDLGSNEKILVQEESSESLFSLSIDSRKHVGDVELGEKEVNSPMPVRSLPIQEDEEMGLSGNGRDRSEYVRSVLNPVENLSQWNAVKTRATPLSSKYQEKENSNLMQELDGVVCPVQSFKLSTHESVVSSNSKKALDQEIAVDTSLSSWLVESETTPMSNTSTVSVGNSPSQNANKPGNHEDKPILAAFTVKEADTSEQLSAFLTSPRRPRSQSPDEPVIGTVGSYWSCTGKIMDSDYSGQGLPLDRSRNKEDERVKWNSVPFETRLDKALNTSIAEV